MPTDKPRFTITMNDSLFSQIENFKFNGHYKSQTKAVIALIEKGLDVMAADDPDLAEAIKSASPYTSEAMQLASDYDNHMDIWGQKVVRGVADAEMERHKEGQTKKADLTEIASGHIKMPKAKKKGKFVEIKVYDEPAAAGLGNYLDEPEYHLEQYPEHIIPQETDFGVRIDGDSMEPKIHDGYTVFIEAKSIIEPGQIGIFVLNGKSFCKKLMVDHEHRQTLLVSINKAYDDILIQEDDFLKPLGRVLGQWGPESSEDDFLDWIGR